MDDQLPIFGRGVRAGNDRDIPAARRSRQALGIAIIDELSSPTVYCRMLQRLKEDHARHAVAIGRQVTDLSSSFRVTRLKVSSTNSSGK